MTTKADKVWWTRPGFIAAAAFLVLVTVLAVWISTTSNGTETSGQPPTTPASTSTPRNESSTTTSPAGDPPSSVTEQELTKAPADATWTLWQGIALPSSPDAGPADVHDGIAEGYTDTPAGALIAAVNIVFRATGDSYARVVEAQFVAGAGRDLMLADPPAPPRTDAPAPQLAGFRFNTFSPERADIELVLRQQDGQLFALTVSVVWSDGDWAVVPTLQGEAATGYRYLDSLAGYEPWAGAV